MRMGSLPRVHLQWFVVLNVLKTAVLGKPQSSLLSLILAQPRDALIPSENSPTDTRILTTLDTYKACQRHSDCQRQEEHCDRHYLVCLPRRYQGEHCRRNYECHKGLECRFGTCAHRKPRGTEGAKCRKDGQCNSGLCCARKHGQGVCQRRLELGSRCYAPMGGLDYSLDEICPCLEGLQCKFVPNNMRFDFKPKALMNSMKCVPRGDYF